jgi:hypothetical protein
MNVNECDMLFKQKPNIFIIAFSKLKQIVFINANLTKPLSGKRNYRYPYNCNSLYVFFWFVCVSVFTSTINHFWHISVVGPHYRNLWITSELLHFAQQSTDNLIQHDFRLSGERQKNIRLNVPSPENRSSNPRITNPILSLV